MDLFNSLMVGVNLITVTPAILALLIGLFYLALRLGKRVADLERKHELLESTMARSAKERPSSFPAAGSGGRDDAEGGEHGSNDT